MNVNDYPVKLSIDYQDRPLNRLTSFFRIIVVIPILIVLSALGSNGYSSQHYNHSHAFFIGGSLLSIAPAIMIIFRQKYPKWWFNWNLELLRFINRIGVYLALIDDKYPSTDDQQTLHLDIKYPNVKTELNRWLPLIKWFLAIPHYIVLFFLNFVAIFLTIVVWFVILFTGKYPKSIFSFVEGVFRWNNRVFSYAFLLVTDKYPPFSFEQ